MTDETQSITSEEPAESPEPRSLLGIPLRPLLALGSVALPSAAIAWFSATHDWPPPPSCAWEVFACPSAPYPISSSVLDWIDLAGPVLGVVCAIAAARLMREQAEPNVAIVLFRYAGPIVGIVVSIALAIQLSKWITH